jgi:hypothetical protein
MTHIGHQTGDGASGFGNGVPSVGVGFCLHIKRKRHTMRTQSGGDPGKEQNTTYNREVKDIHTGNRVVKSEAMTDLRERRRRVRADLQ